MEFCEFCAAREREVLNLLQTIWKLYPFEILASGKCPVMYDCHAVAEYQCLYALTTSEGEPIFPLLHAHISVGLRVFYPNVPECELVGCQCEHFRSLWFLRMLLNSETVFLVSIFPNIFGKPFGCSRTSERMDFAS